MKVSFVSTVNVPAILNRVDNDGFWLSMANEWYRLMGKYTPHDTGELQRQVTIKPKQIIHNVPYAIPVYKGKHLHFKTDKNPYATSMWDVAAQKTELPKLMQFAAEYFKKRL